jgi:hypothetical protein
VSKTIVEIQKLIDECEVFDHDSDDEKKKVEKWEDILEIIEKEQSENQLKKRNKLNDQLEGLRQYVEGKIREHGGTGRGDYLKY